MMFWYIGLAYIALLCALVFATFRRGEPMRRTVLTLFAVMLTAYAYSFGVPKAIQEAHAWGYSLFMIGVNAIACLAIVRHPATKWQSVIGWSLILQIGTDAGNVAAQLYYGASDVVYVYWATTGLAYAQLFLVGGWLLDELLARHSGYGADHPLPDPARRSGMA
jgi:hypothetical protein